MTKHKIFFRADASATIGYGHFIRTLALADMLKEDFDCTFFTSSPSAYQIDEISKVCRYIALNEETKFEDFINLIDGGEIVVLDNYFFTTDYQRTIKAKGCKLVCVDDLHDRHFVSDLVLNPALLSTSDYDVESYTKLCLGLEYALLRKPFIKQDKDVERVYGRWLLAFGGSDFDNMTEKYLSFLQGDSRVKEVTVIVGDAYKYYDNLKNYTKASIYKNLTAEKMSIMMRQAEYAVLPSSTISIEALASGCKVANGYFVDNQIETSIMYKQEGYCVGMGDLRKVSNAMFIDELLQFNPSHCLDFSLIPLRYKQLFNSL